MNDNRFLDLTGQTAIVTGAATGIGEAIARRLAKAGAFVFVADRDGAAAEATASSIPNAAPLPVDVTNAESVRAAVEQAIAKNGSVDILVNNAGIAGSAAPVTEYDEMEFRRVFDVNVIGVFLCTKAVLGSMKQKRYGRIVNIASIAGKEGNPNMPAYSASKAAVIGFTKSVAKEVATEGICINAVAPAVVQTKILDQLTPQQVSYMTEKIPMRRTGKPEEIAAIVHFLASPDASFVTGQTYDASGGRATY
ncbi:MAG TPA: SDR family NAD(P)-dependent oxidoreductase [Bryobacteraceae bacterium]|jgi:3-oxoacyl-[acyl-carrier protein] reductase|nr:SDR family NAD(P)-dependent oxidoreductase [Bryobacteraceae bacterium]